MGFFPCAFVGLLSFPEQFGSRDEKLTFALDAATLMVGGGTMILQFVILPVAGAHSAAEVALSSYYPLADLVLVLGGVVVLLRHVPRTPRSSRVTCWASPAATSTGSSHFGPSR